MIKVNSYPELLAFSHQSPKGQQCDQTTQHKSRNGYSSAAFKELFVSLAVVLVRNK